MPISLYLFFRQSFGVFFVLFFLQFEEEFFTKTLQQFFFLQHPQCVMAFARHVYDSSSKEGAVFV